MATYSNGVTITNSGVLATPSNQQHSYSATTYTVPSNRYAIISVVKITGTTTSAIFESIHVGEGGVVTIEHQFGGQNSALSDRTVKINSIDLFHGTNQTGLLTVNYVEFGNFN